LSYPNELTIKIAGEAGQGMNTVGDALCKVLKKAGFYIFSNQDYMSRVRGGNNYFQIRISDKPLYALRGRSNLVVALDKPSVSIYKDEIEKDGVILPIFEIAKTTGGEERFVNSAACGVVSAMLGIDFGSIENVIRQIFANKDQKIIDSNINVLKAGYDYCKNNFKSTKFNLKKGNAGGGYLINGNEAIGLGAISAGCKFYCAYPMTPSTGILNLVSHYAKKFNIVVEQAEDEIAAVNMIIGASFVGARSMTGTSGGGFALMVEGLSLAGMTETPIVIVDAQRPAPATGFPTRTEQADLNFLIHAGHGEFARVIYTPGTIEECFYLTIKAFNIAEKYQIPVLIMTDQHLADSNRNIDTLDSKKIKVERHIISKEESRNVSNYKRYKITESGISPRAIPSWIDDVFYVDSDEHTEDGHITEDAQTRNLMVDKRLYKKMDGLSKEVEKPVSYYIEKAEIILIGFGSTYGVLKEVCEALSDKKIGFIHLPQVWPFPGKDLELILKGAKKIVTVENNAGAQLAGLLRRETGISADLSILKYDGRPFDLDYLIGRINKEVLTGG